MLGVDGVDRVDELDGLSADPVLILVVVDPVVAVPVVRVALVAADARGGVAVATRST